MNHAEEQRRKLGQAYASERAANAALTAECERLREQRDDALARVKSMHESVRESAERAEKAFKERDRLREQLGVSRAALGKANDE